MTKRWIIYLREMYPAGQSVTAAFLLSGALYFLTVLTCKIPFEPSWQEAVGCLTAYCSLLFLRIADDFKDEEIDKKLFGYRPYPSGRVTKRDLKALLGLDVVVMCAANLAVVNHVSLAWFGALMGYMLLMSFWFFQRKRIQKNLLLALITHNPCMLLMNYYILSITCRRFGLELMTWDFLCVNLMLYLPALEYEVSRKIKAPRDESEYVTYSKTLGLKGAVGLLLTVSLVEVLATIYIAWVYMPKVWSFVFGAYYLCYFAFGVDFVRYPEGRGNARSDGEEGVQVDQSYHGRDGRGASAAKSRRRGLWRMGDFARCYIVVMQGTLIAVAGYMVVFGA